MAPLISGGAARKKAKASPVAYVIPVMREHVEPGERRTIAQVISSTQARPTINPHPEVTRLRGTEAEENDPGPLEFPDMGIDDPIIQSLKAKGAIAVKAARDPKAEAALGGRAGVSLYLPAGMMADLVASVAQDVGEEGEWRNQLRDRGKGGKGKGKGPTI